MQGYIELGSYYNAGELSVLLARFDSENIVYEVRNQYVSQLYSINNSIGGTRLLVHPMHIERAIIVLKENGLWNDNTEKDKTQTYVERIIELLHTKKFKIVFIFILVIIFILLLKT